MHAVGGAEHGEKSDERYFVCDGGYRVGEAATFEEAVTLAKRLRWLSPDGAFSIYEVRTGIHFEVPRSTFTDDLARLASPSPWLRDRPVADGAA
ncbi:hypothetical protein M2323_003349 [Rhodoblastus acidophilus]|nr:hypothetical protein [Rhodoblastus acidophilus]MCW2334408.1 hypothetical protein [Rhodoblastus acidophilus]